MCVALKVMYEVKSFGFFFFIEFSQGILKYERSSKSETFSRNSSKVKSRKLRYFDLIQLGCTINGVKVTKYPTPCPN